MTHDEMIAVIQAHKDGKPIESRVKIGDRWGKTAHPGWNFAIYDYRVIPQPREMWVVTSVAGLYFYAYSSRKEAEKWWPNQTYVRFIEALETPSPDAKAKNT